MDGLLDQEVITALENSIQPDPLTGKYEISDVLQYLVKNPNDPNIKKLLEAVTNASEKQAEEKRIADTFDLSTLSLHRHTIWLISLEYSGLTTEKTHSFQLYCYIKAGPGADPDVDNFRCVDDYIGLPTSQQVESFIRLSMTKPNVSIFPPSIPNTLLFSYNLAQHEAALQPFLQSIQAPFQWGFEPAAVSQYIGEQSYIDKEIRFEKYMKISQELKGAGNAAYARNDREVAIKGYTEAIRHLEKMLFKGVTDAEERVRAINEMAAVCYSNSAAARLIPGDGVDAEGAVTDAELALKSDANYAKAYIRLSRAHEALGDRDQAQEAIARALRRPQLKNHPGLVDHLISLQTSGRGLPQELESFQVWIKNVLVDDKASAERMEVVGGEWRRRCDEQRKKLGAPDNI